MILPKKYSIANLLNNRLPPTTFYDFSKQTKSLINSLFTAIIQGHKSNEKYKVILNSTPNSSATNCYDILKPSYSNTISKNDLYIFCKNYGKILSPFELELLMNRFDKNNDGIISYNEFTEELVPNID